MRIERYAPSLKAEWDAFVAASKNGTFLFFRDYMEYHADRFVDHSLVCRDDEGHIVALLPASSKDGVVTSHGGLTYGGVVSGTDMKTATMLAVFAAMLDSMRLDGMTKLVYKAIPHVFHRFPAEEDLYALFAAGARLYRRDASSVLYLPEPLELAKGKREGIRKATRANLAVRESDDFDAFFAIGGDVMRTRHGLAPTHTSDEMRRLAARFPGNIRLFASYDGDAMLAGAVIYDFGHAVHTQYMYNSDRGLALGALDLVVGKLIGETYANRRYFSFGVSTEKDGAVLNEGLSHQKEMFGARAVVHDFYEIDIATAPSRPALTP